MTSDIEPVSITIHSRAGEKIGWARCQTNARAIENLSSRIAEKMENKYLTRYLTRIPHFVALDPLTVARLSSATSKKRRGCDFSLSTPFLSLSLPLPANRHCTLTRRPYGWSYKGVELQAKCLTFRRGNEDHAFRMLVDQPTNQVDLLECQLHRVEVLRGARHVG